MPSFRERAARARRFLRTLGKKEPQADLPGWLPEARVVRLPGRGGETVVRHHVGPSHAPTVFLLHGWTTSADLQWWCAYEPLITAGISFVAIDHRSHGRGLRSEEPFTLEACADDAAAVIAALRLGPVVAVGYSMGGPIAMHLWHRHPELVRGLVLEATALEWRATRRDRATWHLLSAVGFFMRSRRARRMTARFARYAAEENPDLEPYRAWFTAEYRRLDTIGAVEAGRALAQHDARPWASLVDVPAAMVITTDDHLVYPAKQRALAEALRAEVVELAGDHDVYWTQGAPFAKATLDALQSVFDRVEARSSR